MVLHGVDDPPGPKSDSSRPVPYGPSPWRRLAVLVAGAACVTVVIVWVLTTRQHGEDEIARLETAIAEMASQATPDIADLLQEAGAVATRLLERFPRNADALVVIARLHDRLGDADEAARCWRRCLQMDPSLAPTCHAAIAAIAQEKGDLDQAASHFRSAMGQDPKTPTYPIQLAEVLIDQGNLHEAVALLEKNRETRPRSMPTFALLGQAYLQLREYEKARRFLEMAIQKGPGYTNAYYGLANACAKLGDQEKSKEYLSKFKELQGKDEQRHRDALKTSKDVDVDEFRRSVAQVYTAAARVYIGGGDVRTGEEYLLRATELAADGAECRGVLALFYETQGRTKEALTVLAELREKDVADLGIQLSIAAAYARLQQFGEAETAFQKAIALTPHQAGGYAALADFYLRAGRKLDEAKRLAQVAVEMEPVAKYYFLLCQACLQTDDKAGALTAIEQAVALDTENPQYRDLHEMLRRKE